MAVRERDAQIRELTRQVETLLSNRPSALAADAVPHSDSRSEANPWAPGACGPELKQDSGSDNEPIHSDVRWHSVSLGDPISPPNERKDARRGVELEVVFEPETQFYTGLTQDISGGGVFIATYDTQPIGTLLSLSFELPCGTVISVFGEVRWLRDGSEEIRPGMGVAFIGLAEESKLAIERFCRAKSPLYVEL